MNWIWATSKLNPKLKLERCHYYLNNFNKLIDATIPRENRLSNNRYLMKKLLQSWLIYHSNLLDLLPALEEAQQEHNQQTTHQ